jgi:diadenosine tetraphosphate (Ap4A) HIT family hydrolase
MSDKRQITDVYGNVVEVDCIGCAIIQKQVETRGEPVLETAHFNIHQDFEIPIPGFMIMASNRHIQSVDEFTAEERSDFIDSLASLRKALRKTLSVEHVYLIQEEDTKDHFHLWVFPRYDWMLKDFGRKIESVRPIMEYARANLKTPENLAKLDETIDLLRSQLN